MSKKKMDFYEALKRSAAILDAFFEKSADGIVKSNDETIAIFIGLLLDFLRQIKLYTGDALHKKLCAQLTSLISSGGEIKLRIRRLFLDYSHNKILKQTIMIKSCNISNYALPNTTYRQLEAI